MADINTATDIPDATAGDNAPIRLRMGEVGVTGLKICRKQVLEEVRRDLRWPNVISIYKEMSHDATISSALSLIVMMIEKVQWEVLPPYNATPEQISRARFIKSCMDDMEHSWRAFIKEVISYVTYGFSVHEKVFRRRLSSNGSRYNDGLVGWAKLPIRSQDTIEGWEWSDDGRDLKSVIQNIALMGNEQRYLKLANDFGGRIKIPRNKFLLFRYDAKRDNPEGNSPLKNVYISYKYRSIFEEMEAIAASRNIGGIPVIKIPARYMSKDASETEKAIADEYKNIGRNVHNNEQAMLLLPSDYDQETKMPMFEFELLAVKDGSALDLDESIKRHDNKILMALFADLLKMGQDKVGSFALAGEKVNLMTMAIEAKVLEIEDVLNNDLIPQTFALNGWDDSEFPRIIHKNLDKTDTETLSKAIQRIVSVGAVEVDREFLNMTRSEGFGLEPYPDSDPVHKEFLLDNTSGASKGMNTKGDGTGDSSSDTTTSNSEN